MSTHPYHRPPSRPLALVPSSNPTVFDKFLALPLDIRTRIYRLALVHSSNPPVFDNFLALPLEIRIMIYRLALVPDPDPRLDEKRRGKICLPRAGEVATSEDIIDPRTPSLLRTCRQIRNEGLPVFYSSNHFHLRFSYVFSGTMLKLLSRYKRSSADFDDYDDLLHPEVAPQTLLRAFPPGDNLVFMGRLTALWSDRYKIRQSQWQLVSVGFVALGNKRDAGERDGNKRIGDDATNWEDEEEVRRAYIEALERPQAWYRPPGPFGYADEDEVLFMDVVRTMQAFKRRCPRAMEWVEAKAFWPRKALRKWLRLVYLRKARFM